MCECVSGILRRRAEEVRARSEGSQKGERAIKWNVGQKRKIFDATSYLKKILRGLLIKSEV